jgi:hypothetical protein
MLAGNWHRVSATASSCPPSPSSVRASTGIGALSVTEVSGDLVLHVARQCGASNVSEPILHGSRTASPLDEAGCGGEQTESHYGCGGIAGEHHARGVAEAADSGSTARPSQIIRRRSGGLVRCIVRARRQRRRTRRFRATGSTTCPGSCSEPDEASSRALSGRALDGAGQNH